MQLFKKKKYTDYIIFTAIILGGILIDVISKYLVTRLMTLGESIPLIKGFLHITYTTNDGAAFGMMDGQRWIFILVSSVTIVGLLLYLYLGHTTGRLYDVSVSMIISGGIGNMIERLGFGFYVNENGVGEVVDFIDFCGIWNAIFNGADSFVCVGAGLLILAMVLEIIKEAKENKAQKK